MISKLKSVFDIFCRITLRFTIFHSIEKDSPDRRIFLFTEQSLLAFLRLVFGLLLSHQFAYLISFLRLENR